MTLALTLKALHMGQPLLQGGAAVNQQVLQSALNIDQPLLQGGAAVKVNRCSRVGRPSTSEF